MFGYGARAAADDAWLISNKQNRSDYLYERALKVMVGGVNSPVRSFRAVGGKPIFFQKGKGSRLFDVDGKSYLDYVCSWGALILGHADDEVTEAICRAAREGTSFGAPCEAEVKLAEEVTERMKSVEMVRFVNSGTEATMSAIRLARGYTGKKKIIKFAGCYHGHYDSFLADSGSGMATFSIPISAGVIDDTIKHTLTLAYNDVAMLENVMAEWRDDVAAVILEPIAGNMGVVPASKEFIEKARELCDKYNSLLIFDEVISGFRVARGGAQELYGIKPDITCLGKIIGGGMPVGAYGGSRQIMKHIAPEGNVYQAGTLAGNPVAMSAGLATLRKLGMQQYEQLERLSYMLEHGIKGAAEENKVSISINRVGSMIGIFFTDSDVKNYVDARKTDAKAYSKFFHYMLTLGVYLPPSPFETVFLSTSHSDEDIRMTVESASKAFQVI
ncbi:MAG: glutamate-1-semialdehyde 2,1-aminomutase [Conexivisphaerales archaeon]